MSEGADSGAAWENPLIPNARLRQIYLAMVRARMLGRTLPAGQRGPSTQGLEACLVSAAVDLGRGDLVSDALAGGVVDFLRGGRVGSAAKLGGGAKRRGLIADCGSAARLPEAGAAVERIWLALGAAAVMKSRAAMAKIEAKAAGVTAEQMGVVAVYAQPGEVSPALWRRVLSFAAKQELPMVFVVLPLPRGSRARAGKPGAVSALALRCGVAGIAVDADDAVAIYRVAQESIWHARIGGGPALMEAVTFVPEGGAGKSEAPADAIEVLERTMLLRGVATRSWMEREAKSFAKRAAKHLAASK